MPWAPWVSAVSLTVFTHNPRPPTGQRDKTACPPGTAVSALLSLTVVEPDPLEGGTVGTRDGLLLPPSVIASTPATMIASTTRPFKKRRRRDCRRASLMSNSAGSVNSFWSGGLVGVRVTIEG